MMERIFPPWQTGLRAAALLILRVVTGAAFIFHGWPKIQNPLHWLDRMPNPPPAALQALAAVAEFGGGIALVLGFLTPLAALGIAANMVVALGMVHIPHGDPFVGTPGKPSAEPAADYLAIALVLLLLGPGVLSLDAWLFRRRPPTIGIAPAP